MSLCTCLIWCQGIQEALIVLSPLIYKLPNNYGGSAMKFIVLGVLALGLTSCGEAESTATTSATSAAQPAEQTAEQPATPDPRTRNAAALDAVGIDGARVRAKVDSALHAIEANQQAAVEEAEK